MKKEISEKELFETIPVPKAVATLGNLFGLGGGSLISRMMGIQNHEDIKHVSAFCVWIGAAATLVFSLLTFAFRRPLLNFLGASPDTYDYAQSYLLWVVVIGGVPTMLSLSLGHLLRSEGHARPASIGMMFGGILNVVLDPVLIFGFDLDVAGAAIATAFSKDQRFASPEEYSLSIHSAGILRRPGHSAWQCLQYGHRQALFGIRRYPGGSLRHRQAD